MKTQARREQTYAEAGVDRRLRAESKKALEILRQTYRFSGHGSVVKLPYGNIFPIGGDLYLDLVIEGVGSKTLVAQLADKYDTIGIDGVAMAVNDVVRSGARPLAVADNIHAHVSEPALVKEWLKGIAKGASEAQCIVPSGEIGDVPDLIKGLAEGKGFDMVFSSVGIVHKERVIQADRLKPGDAIIGLASSGVHSNGITLARKVLFKQWGGKYEPFDVPDGLDRELVYEVLEPTRIYVRPFMKLVDKGWAKAAVHVTGDAYLKFEKLTSFSKGIGFEFDRFKPQPIFELIRKTSEEQRNPVSNEEMFRTFNMGWGFVVIVDDARKDETVDLIKNNHVNAEQIGKVTSSGKIVAKHYGKTMLLRA